MAAPAKRGDLLRIGIADMGPEGFLTHFYSNTSRFPHALPFEYGAYISASDPTKYEGGLIESWTSSPDSKQWTFKIRKGVQWDKGQGEVTAEDIAYTLNQVARPESKQAHVAFWRPLVKEMKVTDPYTLSFNLSKVETDMLMQLSQWSATQIMCKKYVDSVGEDKANREPVGSGPYRVTRFAPGSQMDLEAVGPTHWRVSPMWDKMQFQQVAEDATRFALLTSGRADLVDVGADQLEEAQKNFLVIRSFATNNPTFIFGGMFLKGHPQFKGTDAWQDVKVREAMNIALDREAINKAYDAGLATYEPYPMAGLAPPTASLPLFMDKIPFDPDRAKQLIKESGKTGFDFELVSLPVPRWEVSRDVVQAAASYWENIGLKPRIVSMDRDAMRDIWIKNETNNKVFIWSSSDDPAYASQVGKWYNGEVAMTIYDDPYMETFRKELATTADGAKRDKMLLDAQVYLLKNWAMVPLYRKAATFYAANKDKVKPWPRNGTSRHTAWEYIEPK